MLSVALFISYVHAVYLPRRRCAQIKTKLEELETIIALARSQIMTHMASISDASGVSVEGDFQSERDDLATKLEEVGLDLEMAQFSSQASHSSTSPATSTSSQRDGESPGSLQQLWQQGGAGTAVRSMPDRNTQFCGSEGIYMQKLKSCILNLHNDTAKSLTLSGKAVVANGREKKDESPDNAPASQQFVPEYIAVLGSESGLGKSELVREYCHQLLRASHSPALIGWISATDEASLVLSFRELAMYIKSVHPTKFCADRRIASLKKDALFRVVISWIQSLTESWILVIDNLDSEDILVSQAFLPFVCSSSSPCTVIVTSRLLDLPFRWDVLMEKKSADMLTRYGQRAGTSLMPAVMSSSHQLLSQEIHALSSSKIGAVHVFPMSEDEAYALAAAVLGEEIDSGSRWNRDGQKYIKKICGILHYSPIAIKQAFSCIKVVQQHRLALIEQKDASASSLQLSQVDRLKEYSNWLEDCRESAEKAFGTAKDPFATALYQTCACAITFVCDKAGSRPSALDRALGLLAFLSPSAFDLRMIAAWFLPPNTPFLVKVQKKWRMPVHTPASPASSALQEPLRGYSHAEFEILVESVCPVTCSAGSRFSWRVFRSFDRIKDSIDAVKKIFAVELSDALCDFPSVTFRPLPASNAPDDLMEEAVSRRRVEIQTFFEKLASCRLWGQICTCESMRDLLGITETVTKYSSSGKLVKDLGHLFQPYNILDIFNGADAEAYPTRDDDKFGKLVSPLFSLGFVSVFKKRDILLRPAATAATDGASPPKIDQLASCECRSWLMCSMNRDTQLATRAWLKAEGRYDKVQNDVVKFLNSSFRHAYQKSKRGSDVFSVKDSSAASSPVMAESRHHAGSSPNALSCEQLILHVLSTLSSGIASCLEECFELASVAYHYCSEEGLFAEALFCATLCVEIITQREGSLDSVEDGVWHSYLADMLCRLGRGDEANSMYEHSLLVLRKACGHYHKQTYSVLARFGENLFAQGKYKHAIKIMEEALKVCRHINSKANGSGIGGKLLDSFSPTTSKSVSTITSLPVAGQIEQLVEVLLAIAPDNRTVKRCLDLKREQLSILRRAHGEFSLQVARCLNSIGELEQKDHSKKAREYFEDCLDVLVRCVGGESRELISPMHNLAMEEHAARNFSEAKRLYQRAIEIYSLPTLSTDPVESAVIASVHDSLGMLLGDEGDHETSMLHLEKGYKMYCELYGSENHEVAISLGNLARAWHRMGDVNMAKSLYAKSLKTLRQLGGRADEDIIARNLNALGEIFMSNKEYEEARQLFMECLSARVNLYGERHLDTVAVMKNLSVLAYTTKSYDEAHSICFAARAIQVDLDGTDATVQAAALTGHLAEISRVLGKVSEAEGFYKDAISLYRKIYGENHPSISVQLNNMASMLFTCKRVEEAEELYVASRNILIKFHGKEHTAVAAAINSLAKLHGALGRYAQAMALHSEALGILLKLHGSENEIVADALMEISELLLIKKDFNESMDACSQALGIRTRLFGDNGERSEIVSSLYLMGRIRVKTGEANEAMKLFQDAIRMQARLERAPEESSRNVLLALFPENDIKKVVANIHGNKSTLIAADIIEDICRMLSDKTDLELKILLFEKCLQIRRSILGEEDEGVADSLALLGDLLYQHKQFSESIELQRVARAVKVKIRGENHPSSILSLNSIAKCLKAVGRLDEARSMFEQCVILTRRLYGDRNFSTSVALFELSRMLQLVEDYDSALTMAEQALEIRIDVEKSLEGKPCPGYGSISPHYYLGQLYQHLGELHKSLRDAEHAKLFFLKSRNLNRDLLDGLECDDGIDAMTGLAWALESLGRRDEAAPLAADIKRCSLKVYATKDASFVKELNDMGKILRSRGKYQEARAYFTKALTVGRTVHGQEHVNTVESMEGLAWLLEVQGKSAEATKLHAEVAKLRASLSGEEDDDEGGGLGSVLHSSAASLLGRLSLLLSEKSTE